MEDYENPWAGLHPLKDVVASHWVRGAINKLFIQRRLALKAGDYELVRGFDQKIDEMLTKCTRVAKGGDRDGQKERKGKGLLR